LAGRIPDLQFDLLIADFQRLDFEINAYRRQMNIREIRLRVPRQQRTLANPGIADNNDLWLLERKETEKVIAGVRNQEY
jgi:hypothetical protein